MNTLSHVAIIMDGNGRWANKKNLPRKYGHLEGSKNIKKIVNFLVKKNIKYLTLFAFSYDNWNRPKAETNYLFNLFKDFFKKNSNYLLKKNIKIKFIGEKKKLSKDIKKIIKDLQDKTKNKKDLILSIALNYSSKLELLRAFKKNLNKKKITIQNIDKNLDTAEEPNPEILIRTGGQSRLSNFLLWQCSYTEFFFIKKLWPDFNTRDLNKIINKYKKIKRNFGKV